MEAIMLKPAGLYTDDGGKIYRKLATSDAAKNPDPVRGIVTRGEGEKAKKVHAFFEEVKTSA